MSFTHLHLHTEYSLLDGACRIPKLVERIKALGMTSCAITDHGVMYGCIDFYSAMKDAGIKPIIGCEVYVCRDRLDKSAANREYSHLILLCENNTGYQNLMKLVSEGFLTGYYYRPRIDYNLIRQHSEGLICLSACLSGDLPKLLLQGRYDDAEAYVREMQDIFGEKNGAADGQPGLDADEPGTADSAGGDERLPLLGGKGRRRAGSAAVHPDGQDA